jgi:hypothetical protein
VQFTKAYKQAIASGELTTSFRVWKSPQARYGGQYNIPPYGAIEVDRAQLLRASEVTRAALRRARLENHQALCDFLRVRPDDEVYQVDFHFLGEDPVKQVDQTLLDDAGLTQLQQRLQRMDKSGAWTLQVLQLIAQHPGTGARVLAPETGMELTVFKRNVRKLKSLGLTISLETGYRLSPRGEQLLKH